VGLGGLDLGQRTHREGDIRGVLVGSECARRRELGVGRRPVDDVPARNHDIVRASEEVECGLFQARCGPRGGGTDLRQLLEVYATDRIGEVFLGPLHDLRGLAEAMVLPPVLRRHDFEQVAEASELGDGVVQRLRGHAAHLLEPRTHQPRLFRCRLRVAVDAEGAETPVFARAESMRVIAGESQRTVRPPRDRPDPGSGQRPDLLDRPVGQASDRSWCPVAHASSLSTRRQKAGSRPPVGDIPVSDAEHTADAEDMADAEDECGANRPLPAPSPRHPPGSPASAGTRPAATCAQPEART